MIEASKLLMALACVLFLLSAIATFFETKNWKLALALTCVAMANALLLWEAQT